jgi:molecular chaperone GrpE
MPEIDKAADAARDDETRPEPPPLERTEPALTDELDLEVIEGLAEEELALTTSPEQLGPLLAAQTSVETCGAAVVLSALDGLSEQFCRRLDLLKTMVERELRAEATRERVVDRLHAELQDYKQDFLLKVQRPIFIDLIQLHDDIGKMSDAKAPSVAGPLGAADNRGVLESIQTAIEDILYRQGVEPFALDGTEFDPRKQRAVSTQATDDPALNKTVAARLRKGFCAGDKLIRPEIVTVFTFRPAPAADNG